MRRGLPGVFHENLFGNIEFFHSVSIHEPHFAGLADFHFSSLFDQ
jgi:hypothetical protein